MQSSAKYFHKITHLKQGGSLNVVGRSCGVRGGEVPPLTLDGALTASLHVLSSTNKLLTNFTNWL